MIGSYVKTSGRSILRNKLFSGINIVGLAISMCVGLLMIGMLSDSYSYDKFHSNHERIYRLISQYQFRGQKDHNFHAATSLRATKLVRETVPGIEDVAILGYDFAGDVTQQEKTIPLTGLWANESFFNVFSFQLLHGNPATALRAPFSAVLTETSARKLFDDGNALGKTFTLDKRQYTVTGVMKDIPVFSHMKFEMLGSLSTREITEKDNPREWAWDNMWTTWAYVLISPEANLQLMESNLDDLSRKEDQSVKDTHIELALQPMDDIVVGENLDNPIGPTMGNTTIWILGSLSLIVVISACFNYTNLSIARSTRRSREVGIRKTIGAQNSHVLNQFIIESVIISLLALIFAFLLFLLIKPHFINLEPSLQQLLVLDLSPKLVGLFILFSVAVGVVAGFFPALFFARVNAIHVLKNLSAVPLMKGVTLKRVLIVFQYSLSIIAITATLIIYKQYNHFIAYDLGFTTENIVNFPLQRNNAALLKKELEELPEVKGVSQSIVITSIGDYWGGMVRDPANPDDSAFVYHNIIDEHYLPLHEHTLIAGSNFKAKPPQSGETEVIVNQEVLKRFNIANQNPQEAIGEVLNVEGKDLRIIGVLKNFEYGRANNRNGKEVIMRYGPEQAEYLNVKISSTNWPETYAKIEKVWTKIDPVHPLHAKFYAEQIEDAFRGLKASAKVGGFLSLLVICISSIGLLGMVVFTTETRLKEISIRKVMGASEAGLLMLLSKGFLLLLTLAAGISLPLTYLFFKNILLPKIANHAPMGFVEMLVGLLAVAFIALLMIGSQTLKVARTNPAEVLKNE